MTNFTTSINIDNRLLDNRYILELNVILSSKLNAYEERSAKIALDRKYSVVRTALEGLYELGIQHSCNLSDLLKDYKVITGETVRSEYEVREAAFWG